MKTTTLSAVENISVALQQLIGSFTPEQFNTVPFAGSWTAGQTTEHLLKSASGVSELIQGNTAPSNRNPDEKVELLRTIFLDFTIKMQAPEIILPSEPPHQQNALLGWADKTFASILQTIKTEDLTVFCVDFDLPEFGTLTRLEWISFSLAHTQRHMHQLRNIHKHLTGQ